MGHVEFGASWGQDLAGKYHMGKKQLLGTGRHWAHPEFGYSGSEQ